MASVGVEYAGVKAALEVAAKYGEQLAQKTSESGTTTDTIAKSFKFKGPLDLKIVAERVKSRESRVITARCDFDFKLYFVAGGSAWEWRSFHGVFMPALRGLEPENTDYTPFGGSSSLRELVERQPVSEGRLIQLSQHSRARIQFVAEYDSIEHEDLREVAA